MIIQQTLQNLMLFIPETILTATFCLAVITGLIFRQKQKIVGYVVFAGILSALAAVLFQSGASESIFSGMIAVDPFAVFFKCIAAVSMLFILLFSHYSSEVQKNARRMGEYYALLSAMTLGMFLMAGATNVLMMVLAMELVSLSSYVLAGCTKEALDSSEASLKYIIFGAVTSGIMLYGISILFGLTGAVGFSGINHALSMGVPNYYALLLAVIFIFVGFGFKISAVPFHFWTPDVYEGAPITITALLSVASKSAGFAMMMRFLKTVFIDTAAFQASAGTWTSLGGFEWNKMLAVICVLTMTLGNFVAVWQDNLKRLLAYSSIAHAGYMLMGIVVMSDKGFLAVLVYFGVYLFMNLGAFFVVMLVANKTGSEDISAYKGLGYRSPFLGFAMAVFMISLTGIPLTGGFIGKFYLFAALLVDSKWIWLAVVGVLNSVVSLYYYARILRYMYLRGPEAQSAPFTMLKGEIAVTLLLLIPTLLLGLYFTPLVNFAGSSLGMMGIH
jgi:NADH-quinone oxidoreductase subunit N